MNARIFTTPDYDRLGEIALAYRRTFAHGVQIGLTTIATRAAIGERLCIDAADGRATDWALLCDRLTALADEQKRKERLMATTVDDGEPRHACPGGCGNNVPDKWVACTNCFSLLPIDIRSDIQSSRGENRAAAQLVAVQWLRENVEGGQQKNPPKGRYVIADRFGGYPRGRR